MVIYSPLKGWLGFKSWTLPSSLSTEVHWRGCEVFHFLLPVLVHKHIPQCRDDLLLLVSSKQWAMHPSVWLFPEAAAKPPVSKVRAVRLRLRLWKFKLLARCPQPGHGLGVPSGAWEHLSVRINRLGPGHCPVLMRSASFKRVLIPLTHNSCRRD